eukprot:4194335-Amphidinium_carterae.1
MGIWGTRSSRTRSCGFSSGGRKESNTQAGCVSTLPQQALGRQPSPKGQHLSPEMPKMDP